MQDNYFEKKIMVSACLLGENCKYNGGNNKNDSLLKSLEGWEVIPFCPEVMGGLSIPRKPAEIVDGVVRNSDGSSVDKEYRMGAELSLNIAKQQGIKKVILQSRSPSCGVGQIYDGTFSKVLIPGNGVTTELFLLNKIEVIDVEDWVKNKL